MGNQIQHCCNIKEPERGNVELYNDDDEASRAKSRSKRVEVVDHDGKVIG